MDLESTPSQYRYYHEAYKAQPARPAPDIGYKYTREKNNDVVAEWQPIAAQMVSGLQSQLGIQPQKVYLKLLPNKNAFNLTLDNSLREELRAQGFTLVEKPVGVIVLKPEAYRPEDNSMSWQFRPLNGDKDDFKKLPEPSKPDQFKFSLTATRGKQVIGKVENLVPLPAYGYVRGEGRQKWFDRHYGVSSRTATSGTGNARAVEDAQPRSFTVPPLDQDPNDPASLLPEPVEQEAIEEPLR